VLIVLPLATSILLCFQKKKAGSSRSEQHCFLAAVLLMASPESTFLDHLSDVEEAPCHPQHIHLHRSIDSSHYFPHKRTASCWT
jgi:hypothetical protein